jgi:hypothetical protein
MELSGVARQVAQIRQRGMSFERREPHLLSSWSNCWPLPGEESKYQQQDDRPYDSTNEPRLLTRTRRNILLPPWCQELANPN